MEGGGDLLSAQAALAGYLSLCVCGEYFWFEDRDVVCTVRAVKVVMGSRRAAPENSHQGRLPPPKPSPAPRRGGKQQLDLKLHLINEQL